ncbi:MAG: putative sulfate exporter family transporter [Campylobacterota bacterium]|nr:putative sulfate exporter family transporter [Campylobacterota bacterium]
MIKYEYRFGLLLILAISILAILLSSFIAIGAVTIAIILGIIIGNSVKFKDKYNSGITYAEKTILSFSIALMGINLDFSILSQLGIKTIILIILGMIITILSAIIIGKFYGIDKKLSLLLGIGNGVCGSSAISATAPIIKPEKNFIGLSVAIVNLLGTIGIFLLPFIAILFNLNDIDAGILIGNTLQAVGQVTAAGFSISDEAGVSATTVKMGRVLLLTPLVLILIYIFTKNSNNSKNEEKSNKIGIPIFILFFIFFSLISSFSLVSDDIKNIISSISSYSLILAMSAIGLKIHFNAIKTDGKDALKIASLVFLIQIVFSLGFLLLF